MNNPFICFLTPQLIKLNKDAIDINNAQGGKPCFFRRGFFAFKIPVHSFIFHFEILYI